MNLGLKLGHKALILVVMPVMFEMIFVGVLFGLLRQAEFETWRETHSRDVTSGSNQVMKLLYDSAGALFGYYTSRQPQFMERYRHSIDEIQARLSHLETLTAGIDKEALLVAEIETAADKVIFCLEKAADASLDRGLAANSRFRALRKEFESSLPGLVERLNALSDYEKGIGDSSPEAQSQARNRITVLLIAGILGSTILAISLARYFNQSTVEKVRTVIDNTGRMVSHEPLLPRLAGTDEISSLDAVFHDMAEELEAAAKRKQELTSMVAHDLRTPLMSVQGALTLINGGVHGEVPSPADATLKQAETSTGHLIRLINDLLDIEKLEAGKLPMLLAECEVSTLLDRCFDSVSAFAQDHGVDIEVIDFNLRFEADSDRLCQVMINLLSNAIKFSPKGGTVTLKVREVGDEVEFRIIDEGRGVPEEMRTKIFERFQQVEASDGERGKGTGLGLAICKSIVESHYGRIGVDAATTSTGSEFWFIVPKVQTTAEVAAAT